MKFENTLEVKPVLMELAANCEILIDAHLMIEVLVSGLGLARLSTNVP